MTSLPSLPSTPSSQRTQLDGAVGSIREPIVLKDMDYIMARAVPGAIYSSKYKAMVLPVPTGRAATVALALKPSLANDHPELVELRDSLIQDIHPVDHATGLQLHINAPVVHQTLLDDGHDWLEFDHETNEPVPFERRAGRDGPYPFPFKPTPLSPGPPLRWIEEVWPNQDTDLGYAAAMLNKIHFFLLGWTRGYGKTLGTAAIIEANNYKSVLIASPNTAKYDIWVQELEKRLPSHHILVLGNTPAKRAGALKAAQALDKQGHPFVLIVHHEALALIAGTKARASGKGVTMQDGWKKLGIKWDLFAFDESHRLKSSGNNGSQLHRAAVRIPSANRLALSGSLYENSWEELYGPLHWLDPRRYHAQWDDWNLRFLDYVEGYGKVCVGILPGREQAMREELGVFTLVREKLDRSEHHEILVELSPAQRTAYDELVDSMFAELSDGTVVTAAAGVVELTRLRQVATGLELLTNKLADSSKLDKAIKVIKKYKDDDFFVAAWYKASAYGLRDRLEKQGYKVFTITGDVVQGARPGILKASREAVAARKPGDKPIVLIGTIETLGESANLQHFNHVIRLDRSFNPAKNRQVIDRVDRTGQLRRVRATDLIAKNTVDQWVVLPNLANKDAFRAVVMGRTT